jgi:phosphoribosylformimino-5-aminoimidazole carboxamide ribotide isomerase
MTGASGFDILPAIDLRGGRVVRLRQGDFDRETTYGSDPVSIAEAFVVAGARWIHVVDLDGARAGEPVQVDAIRGVIDGVGQRARVEVGGGVRTRDGAASVLAAGASRVVLGTVALADPAMVGSLLASHGADRIGVALDVRNGRAVGHGWAIDAAERDASDAMAILADEGVTTFEVTAIDRDGLLEGPDLHLYERLVGLDLGDVIASGGITTFADLHALRAAGCAGAILGRALYEGRLDLAAAVRFADREPGTDPSCTDPASQILGQTCARGHLGLDSGSSER